MIVIVKKNMTRTSSIRERGNRYSMTSNRRIMWLHRNHLPRMNQPSPTCSATNIVWLASSWCRGVITRTPWRISKNQLSLFLWRSVNNHRPTYHQMKRREDSWRTITTMKSMKPAAATILSRWRARNPTKLRRSYLDPKEFNYGEQIKRCSCSLLNPISVSSSSSWSLMPPSEPSTSYSSYSRQSGYVSSHPSQTPNLS